MAFTNANCEWIPLEHIEGHCKQQINDITKDLSNGIALINLAKVLTKNNIKINM